MERRAGKRRLLALWLVCQVLLLALLPLSPSWAASGHLDPQVASASCLKADGDHQADHDGACAAFCLLLNQAAVTPLPKPALPAWAPRPLLPILPAAMPAPLPGPLALAAPRGPPASL